MDQDKMQERTKAWMEGKAGVRKAGVALLVILCAFYAVKTINELRSGALIGYESQATNIITISGQGEVFATPDIATFSFSVTETAKAQPDAQKAATEKMNAVIAYLKAQGIADKDVQTSDYSIYPKYDYTQTICTQYSCPPSKQILQGYTVSQSVTVKVRDTAKAGAVLAGVGALKVENVSGLSLSIDDHKAIERQAREKAIADAKQQADALAADLGVKIVRIVSYSESGNYPVPMYYAKAMDARGGVANEATPPSPSIPTGENKVTSNVTITYEIR